LTELSIHLL